MLLWNSFSGRIWKDRSGQIWAREKSREFETHKSEAGKEDRTIFQESRRSKKAQKSDNSKTEEVGLMLGSRSQEMKIR